MNWASTASDAALRPGSYHRCVAFLEPNPAPVDIAEPGRRLRLRLYLLSFIDEFGPVYAVFTLLFNDNGISTAQVSWVFVTWGVVAFFLEVPSGMLADQVDRRRLLAAAFGLKAGGLEITHSLQEKEHGNLKKSAARNQEKT